MIHMDIMLRCWRRRHAILVTAFTLILLAVIRCYEILAGAIDATVKDIITPPLRLRRSLLAIDIYISLIWQSG